MGIPLRVLIVEDVEDDAELLVQELRSKGYDPLYERVDTQKAMLEALDRQEWDIIICDYSMPGFNAISALKLMHKIHNDLPFILVSGTIGEDVAVEAMKAGAHDYIMKDKLSRFVPAIQRELVEYKERHRVKQMENAIQALVKGTVGVTGQEFFDRVVSSMCEWLGTDYAFIGQIVDGNKIKNMSANIDGEIGCDCIYDITGTVCEHVVKEGYCVYAEGVSKLFTFKCKHVTKKKMEGYVGVLLQDKDNKPIGVLWTVSRLKLYLPPRATDVMEIIAAKAASEIERMRAEEQVKASLIEKEVLLKEIHHRVKNNMQVISSLLNMQSETIKDDNVLRIFKESQNRVKSMALVHELLYQTKDLSSIDFSEYTRSLTTRLLYSFGDSTKGIQLKIDMDEVCLDVNKAIPCGLIINEIVTNSLKHAFPLRTIGAEKKNEGVRDISKDKDIIKISMHKIADCELSPEDDPGASHRSDSVGQNADFKSEIRNPKSEIIKLVVGDNGIGLPEGLDFRNTKTLGMELVNTLVGQLKGTIEYVKDKGGTEFKITFGR